MYDTTYQSPQERRSSNITKIAVYAAATALIIAGAQLYSAYGWETFSFKPDLASNWNDVFVKYFFIIVAMERSAAVWIGINRNTQKRSWDRRVSRITDIVEKGIDKLTLPELAQAYNRESKIISEIQANQSNTFLGITTPQITAQTSNDKKKEEYFGYLVMTKQVYQFKRTLFEQQTYVIIAKVVFIGGAILAALGLSILSDIIDIESLNKESISYSRQMFYYRIMDIIITGGLLGGGSVSFSVFINTLNSLFNKVKDPKIEN